MSPRPRPSAWQEFKRGVKEESHEERGILIASMTYGPKFGFAQLRQQLSKAWEEFRHGKKA